MFSGSAKGDSARAYGERVAKYVPAEVIAAYLTALPIVISGTPAHSTRRTVWLGLIFAFGIIFTPLYVWRFPSETEVKVYHYVLSTAAFVIWSYSIRGGFLDDRGLYDAVGAALILIVFTLISGLFAPTATTGPS